jgi:hypothetical protein
MAYQAETVELASGRKEKGQWGLALGGQSSKNDGPDRHEFHPLVQSCGTIPLLCKPPSDGVRRIPTGHDDQTYSLPHNKVKGMQHLNAGHVLGNTVATNSVPLQLD